MATTISSTTSGITTQGVGSGLDIAGIVDKLVAVDSLPLTRLQRQESSHQTKLSAFSAARGMLSTFQNNVSALADPTAFSSFAATIGDDGVATVGIDKTQSSALAAGTHTLRVDRLAASQRTASTGFSAASTTVGTGTLTIEIGSWNTDYTAFTPNGTAGSRSITIDTSNNTLTGIRDAINRATAGVTASIINDGSGNRLVLSSTATGAASGFRITTADADGNNVDATGLSQVAFDPAGGTTASSHLADAANASFSLDGLTISKADNHVTDVLAGLVLDLKNGGPTTTTTFTIARDTASVKKNISGFVAAYNALVGNIGSLTSYNATTKAAGQLNGDPSIRLISQKLQAIVASVIPTGGSVTALNDVGVKFTNTGTLEVDDVKLTAALARDPDSIGRLFAKTGTSTDSLVQYASSTDKTQVGNHTVGVTALATHGGLTGSNAAGLTIGTGVNDTFGITVDNVATTITLRPGTYASADALAAAVQSQINGDSAISQASSSVTVSAAGGVLSVTSARYGSASSVVLGNGNGATNLFGSTPAATTGGDVSGTIDGVSFLGSGQSATGATSTSAQGLKLSITGGPTGSRGSVTFNRGLAAQLDDVLTQFLDTDNGVISTATDSINASIKDLQAREQDWATRLVAIRARYTAQYNAMDALVASLNSTSTYLTQQLDALAKSTKSSN